MKKIILPIAFIFCITTNKAQTAGPDTAALSTNSGAGTQWIISSTITTDTLSPMTLSSFWQSTNFGFSIPLSATVTGIVVKSSSSTSDYAYNDTMAKLLKNNIPVGQNKQIGLIPPGNSLVYGSSTDLWGTTWTPAEINNMNFGFQFKAYNSFTLPNTLYFVNHFSITVYYNTAAGISEQTTKTVNPVDVYTSNNQIIITKNFKNDLSAGVLKLSNLLGQNIWSQKIILDNDETKTNVPEIKTGYYILTIDTKDVHFSKKIYLSE